MENEKVINPRVFPMFQNKIDKMALLGCIRDIVLKSHGLPLHSWADDYYYQEFDDTDKGDISFELSVYKELDSYEEGLEYTLELFVNGQYICEAKLSPDGSFYWEEDEGMFDVLVHELEDRLPECPA